MKDLLNNLNEKIKELEFNEISSFNEISEPILFIVAPPRSGTTLIYQLLSLCYDVFYPTNLLAKFYTSPFVLSKVLKDLDLFSSRNHNQFKSNLGNTDGLSEPHEWGWFWEKNLVKDQNLLKKELSAIQSLFQKPMLFKNIYFNYYINELSEISSNVIFIQIHRNSIDNINSIRNAIVKTKAPIGSKFHKGNFNKFINNPLELATLEYLYDTKLITKNLENKNTIHISYDEICNNHEDCLYKFENDFKLILNRDIKRKDVKISQQKKPTSLSEDEYYQISKMLKKYHDFSLTEIKHILFGDKK